MRWARVVLFFAVLTPVVLAAGAGGSQAQSGLTPALFLPAVMNKSGGPAILSCPLFPADNILNRRVDSLPVHARSAQWIASMGASTGLHPDFGANWNGGPFGIPWTSVPGSQPRVPISFCYSSESDPGPYPIPPDAPVEGGSDRHVLVLDRDNCKLYEIFEAQKKANGSWSAGSGAVFDLRSNALRPAGWTSADAAGLSILAGLVRYEEVQSGSIRHAIRFTANTTSKAYLWPARHQAGSTSDGNYPPMGARFRLKASVDISGFDARIQVIFRAFKEYGLILADNGSNWYISGAPDPLWNDDLLVTAFGKLKGSDFEAVDVESLKIDPNSGQSR